MNDLRGYVNPAVPGTTEFGQRRDMTGEIYIENRRGTAINGLIKSVRRGTVVQVMELYCLAPALGDPRVRRRILGERMGAIHERGGLIYEIATGDNSRPRHLPRMMIRAYEQIATSGRARKRDAEGRPPVWPRSGPMYEGMKAIYLSRRNTNDNQRVTAIKKEYGKSPSRVWLRQQFGGTL